MAASSPPSDAERELNELRARAYGPHPDIQADPAALARLTELEAAHIASPPIGPDTDIAGPAAGGAPIRDSVWTASGADRPESGDGVPRIVVSSEGSPRSLRHRLAATRAGRGVFVAGALVAILALAYTVAWLVGPHPDATLRPTADEPDVAVLSVLGFLGEDAEPSDIRGYEPYVGVEPWFFVNAAGFHCFMIVTRPNFVDGANCVPPGVDLFADMTPWRGMRAAGGEVLPDGSMIRFHYRADSVDVFLYPAAEAD